MAARTSTAATPPAMTMRQMFTGRDDLLLLTRVADMPPWSYHGGVMDAWKKIVDALNSDPDCTLSSLTATAGRARFHRMVTQRRERQDKMLRRSVASESEYEQKVAKLDVLIARLDDYNEKTTQRNALYDRKISTSHVQPQPTVMTPRIVTPTPRQHQHVHTVVAQPQPVARVPYPQPQQGTVPMVKTGASVAAVHPPVQQRRTIAQAPTTSAASARPCPQAPSPVTVVPMDLPASRPIQKRPALGSNQQSHSAKRAHIERPLPASANATGATGTSELRKLVSLAEQGLTLMQRKFEQDREIANTDRQWRREQTRAHREMMDAMKEQTNYLQTMAFESQWKGI